jgi:DNA modification methylase
MENHEAVDVYEPFCGSGTTLIAAEQLGRRCFAIEIEPRYVQVAIDRWEAFTESRAIKVGEALRA